MRILFFSAVIVWRLCVSIVRAALHPTPPNSVAQALLWQARQYTHIKTLHFLAVSHTTFRTVKGKKETIHNRYEYWGSGIKYRIDYQEFGPHADEDVVVTDNGRHSRQFYRISDYLTIGPTHPIYGVLPVPQNPILEPLAPLAPYFPFRHHKWASHVQWINLPRFARNPKSIFDRCFQVRVCGNKSPDGSLHGCITGAVDWSAAQVRFKIFGGGWSHPMVTGWIAKKLQYPGNYSYIRLGRIRYRTIRLKSGRKIYLPVTYVKKGIMKFAIWRGPATTKMVISHISLDKPIPLGKFTINYKLAHTVVAVTGHGKSRKFHYFTVHPTTRSAPGRDWNLNKHVPASH